MTRRNYKPMPSAPAAAHVESLAHDGRGVARIDGKTVFIDGALPREQVMFRYITQRRNFDEGEVVEIVAPSPLRVAPRCAHFAICGGCSLQHMDGQAQIDAKQKILLDNLHHIGGIAPDAVMPPLCGPQWGYRRRARLGAKYVEKKQAMLIGFREKRSSLLADLRHCDVLHPKVGAQLQPLAALLHSLSAYNRIPQVEVAVADNATALVFRHLVALTEADKARLTEFGKQHEFQIYLQPGGPDSIELLWPEQAALYYRLDAFDVDLYFRPTDFIQVNGELNRAMVARAVELLDPQPNERVLDLYCGLGNFTLPLARRAQWVVGVEGDGPLIHQAELNAAHNRIDNVKFHVANLANDCRSAPWARGQTYHKILLDPPRAGAAEVLPLLPGFGAQRLVYVSCNPATLARDCGELVKTQGYRLTRVGVMDMFPHTTHVESIAVLER